MNKMILKKREKKGGGVTDLKTNPHNFFPYIGMRKLNIQYTLVLFSCVYKHQMKFVLAM